MPEFEGSVIPAFRSPRREQGGPAGSGHGAGGRSSTDAGAGATDPLATSAGTGGMHLPGLDGLRGVAVMVVVAYHLHWLRGGFLGVDLFFVLSGYLVTTGIVRSAERTGRVGLCSFWWRRIRRLTPLALVVVAAVLGAAIVADWPRDVLGAAAMDGLATLTWWANWRQASGPGYWSTSPSLFRHAWSLSVEEQFYAVWPIVVAGVVTVAGGKGWRLRSTVGWAAAAIAATSAIWMLVLAQRTADLSRVYVGTDTRMFAPVVGCALACWWPPTRSPGRDGRLAVVIAAAAGALVLAVLMATSSVSDPDLYRRGGFVAAALGSGAVLVAASGPRTRLLDVTWLRWLGVRAYGLYLWSWPVQLLAEHSWPEAGRATITLVVVAVTLPLAALSQRVVEEPLRRPTGWARGRLPRRAAWIGGVGAAVAAVVVAAQLAVAPPTHEQVSTEEALAESLDAPPPPLPRPTTTTVPEPGRTMAPAPPPDLRVMLIGDSLAFTADFHAPDQIEGIASIDGRTVIGCGLLAADGWEYDWQDEGFTVPKACERQREAERVGLTGRPDVVVLMPGAWEMLRVRSPEGEVVEPRSPRMADVVVAALLDRARTVADAGARTAIVAWSCPGGEASDELRDPDYTRWINDVFRRAAREGRTSGLDITVIEPSAEVCVEGDPAGAPTPAKDAVTRGEFHLYDTEGATWLWDRWLAPALTGRPA